jgi:hypothetical protein
MMFFLLPVCVSTIDMVTSTLPYIEVENSATTIAVSIGGAINHFVLRKTISVFGCNARPPRSA